MKYLVTNADDFGFTRDVNEGIVMAHRDGILTATTLMANGDAFDHAVQLASQTPTLDIGCHLVLIGGQSLLDPDRCLPSSIFDLTRQVYADNINIYEELAAQVRTIVATGIVPTHLDTHKHTHLLPPVFNAVRRVALDFNIPWVRRPIDFPAPVKAELGQRITGSLIRHFGPKMDFTGLRHTDHFWGFAATGRLDSAALVDVMQYIPHGVTELMTHPGHLTDQLRAAPTRLKESRMVELEALTSPSVKKAVAAAGIALVNYHQLNQESPQ